MQVKTIALVLLALCVTGCAGIDHESDTAGEMWLDAKPGEGVICAMGIYNAMAEVGRRCFAGQDQEYQNELIRAVNRIDRYVLSNSNWTDADLAKFKREQARVGEPTDLVCVAEMTDMYLHSSKQGAPRLRKTTDVLLARPGPPTWGDCL